MRNLVLHIGVAKTGSTALQKFLQGNRELLARHGFYYPATGEAGNGQMDFAKTFVHTPPATMVMPADPDLFPAVPVKVICYLRRQDRRAESQSNQLVGETASFQEFLPRIRVLDYRKLLDP